MFANMAEALEAYKTELRRFKEWNDRGAKFTKSSEDSKVAALEATWTHRIVGMRQALGLTPEETSQIDAEIGLVGYVGLYQPFIFSREIIKPK